MDILGNLLVYLWVKICMRKFHKRNTPALFSRPHAPLNEPQSRLHSLHSTINSDETQSQLHHPNSNGSLLFLPLITIARLSAFLREV